MIATLGQQLQAHIKMKEQAAELQRRKAEIEEQCRDAATHEYVDEHFNRWWKTIVHWISKGSGAPKLFITTDINDSLITRYLGLYGFDQELFPITNENNKYHYSWSHFERVANEHDLDVRLVEHIADKAAGTRHHWALEISPLTNN